MISDKFRIRKDKYSNYFVLNDCLQFLITILFNLTESSINGKQLLFAQVVIWVVKG